MFFRFLWCLLLFFSCSHTKTIEVPKEDRPISLESPIVQKFTPSSLHTLKNFKNTSCRNKNCSRDEFTQSMTELGYLNLKVATLVDIIEEIKNDRSVTIFMNHQFYEAYGLELRDETIFVFDQELKSSRLSFKDFMHKWDAGEFWAKSFIRPFQITSEMEPLLLYKQAKAMETSSKMSSLRTYKELVKHHGATGTLINDIVRLEGPRKRQIKQYEMALTKNPNDELLWNGLVKSLRKHGQRSKAQQVMKKVALMFEHKSDNIY
ncbi:MAG: hypothetical protein KC478_02700 [Bacteriovoracaceae bacterium]|nr:hypothetical protein [Bacteriovoracaceae bacterium]